MFNFLKFLKRKTGPPRNADFDVLSSITVNSVVIKREEIIRLLLIWTQGERLFSKTRLGTYIEEYCKSFRDKYVVEGVILQNTYGDLYARHVIDAYKGAGILKEEGPDVYVLTSRGEKIRQFYVLLTGQRGTLYDRMDEFTQGKKN